MTEALLPGGVATFRTRYVDGWDTVQVCQNGTLIWESRGSQETREFGTVRQLLIAVTGHPRARNWTFARYFRTGRYTPLDSLRICDRGPTLLDLVVVSDSFDPVAVISDPHHISMAGSPGPLVAVTGDSDLGRVQIDTSPVLGIDLRKRGGEVAKLFFAGFGRQMMAAGYDPKDVLQEVYKGLLVRNQGKCPFDVRKASFGHYVHMVCQCVVSNYFRSQGRLARFESVPPDDLSVQDTQGSDDPWTDLQQQIKGNHRQAHIARLLLPLVRQGLDRTEMADQLGIGKAVVSRSLRFLRQQIRLLSH